MLRGEVAPTFTVTITRTDDHVVITTTNPSDGVIIGAGAGFEAAYLSLCGMQPADAGPSISEPLPSRH